MEKGSITEVLKRKEKWRMPEIKVNKLDISADPIAPGQVWYVNMPDEMAPMVGTKVDKLMATEYLMKGRFYVVLKVLEKYCLGIPVSASGPKSKHDIVVNNYDLGLNSKIDNAGVSTIHCGMIQRLDRYRFMNTSSYLLTVLSERSFDQIRSITLAYFIDNMSVDKVSDLIEAAIEYNNHANNSDTSTTKERDKIVNPYGYFYAKENYYEDSEFFTKYKYMNSIPLDYIDCPELINNDPEEEIEYSTLVTK